MDYILAELSASITELKKNPTALIKQAGTRPIAILNHNRPSAYLVPARAFEVLMDLLEDVELARIIEDRRAEMDEAVEVTLDEL
jgi:antitoxin StbD